MKIAIAGAGGIGSFFTKFLYDYGVNRNQFPFSEYEITVFDSDVVDNSNLLHQDFSPEDVGKNKAQLMEDKYCVTAQPRFMTVEDFSNYNIIISCVDSMEFRKQLYEYGWSHPELFWLDGRCNSRNVGAFSSDIPKEEIENQVNDSTERGGCLRVVDKEKKVSHVTPVIVAGILMQQLLNHFRGEKISNKYLLML